MIVAPKESTSTQNPPGPKVAGAEVGLSYDEEKSGPERGFEKTRLLAFKEDGLYNEASALVKPKPERSVMKVRASMYLFCCCFYNCCCCFMPKALVGPVCPNKFCCRYANQCEIRMRRDRWLGVMHTICFIIHATMTYLTYSAGYGKPMELAIFRVKPAWNNTGRNGYQYEMERDFDLRIDYVTAAFFLLSAIFHFVWVIPSITSPVLWSYMTSYIDKCFCPWRFVEYSLSASLMLVAIGMISGLRERAAMISIFMLSFTTMLCGILTELYSRPTEDRKKWKGDPDPVPWDKFNYQAFSVKFRSYAYRMIPHYVGWIPYVTAWYLVLSNFYRQIWDLPKEIQDRIPWFVPVAINGTVVTFSSFTFVQWRYQWTKPEMYWKTELWYGILSATAKLYLGLLLYWNVLLADSAEAAISPEADVPSTFNMTVPLALLDDAWSGLNGLMW